MNNLEVYVFDVGHGDNLLLKLPNGAWGLIDFFFTEPQTEPPSLTFLRNINKNEKIIIDFVHISHYHADHTKGFDSFFNWLNSPDNKERVTVKQLWLPGMIPPKSIRYIINELYTPIDIIKMASDPSIIERLPMIENTFYYLDHEIQKRLKNKTVKPLVAYNFYDIEPEKYQTFCISPSTTVSTKILDDFMGYIKKMIDSIAKRQPFIDENTLSTILKFFVLDHKIKLTFGGDATINCWNVGFNGLNMEHYNERYKIAKNIFIKVSHHGSQHSSSETIWKNLLSNCDTSEELHTFFSTGKQIDDSNGDLKYPNNETLEHINMASTLKNIKVEKHSTNKKVQSITYQSETIPFLNCDSTTRTNQNQYTYGGFKSSRQKETVCPQKRFLGYRFEYNTAEYSSKVFELYVESN